MRKHRLATVLTLLALTLLAACNGDGEPTRTPEATASPSITPTTTPAPATTSTPRPTTIPSGDIFLCGVEQDDLIGFMRYEKPRPSDCNDDGFIHDGHLPDTVATGDFVPRCLQPAGDEGLVILVGPLCADDNWPHAFTTDPRPLELRDQLADGDLIPYCLFFVDENDVLQLTVALPCIALSSGLPRIALDTEPIEVQAVCGAGLTYFSRSEASARDLLEILPTADNHTAFDTFEDQLRPVRDAMSELPSARAQQYFAGWPEGSAILMNARIVERLDALTEDDSPQAVSAVRAQIENAITFYTAGRGC